MSLLLRQEGCAMGDYDHDSKASRNPSAFTRLASGSAKSSGAVTPKKAAAGPLPSSRIFFNRRSVVRGT